DGALRRYREQPSLQRYPARHSWRAFGPVCRASSTAWLPATGNLSPMAPEGELLDEVGDGFADRGEPHFDLAVRCDVRHTAGQSEGLGQSLVQIYLRDALLPGFRQRGGTAPHAPEGIEADRHGGRPWPVGGKKLPHHVQQEVDLQVQAHDVRGVGGVLVRLLHRTMLVHGVPGLQDLQVALRESRGRITIRRGGHLAPDDGKYVLEGQLF